MTNKYYWEYGLYNLALTETIEHDDFSITPLESYIKIRDKTRNQKGKQILSALLLIKIKLSELDAFNIVGKLLPLLSLATNRAIIAPDSRGHQSLPPTKNGSFGIKMTIYGKTHGADIVMPKDLSQFITHSYDYLNNLDKEERGIIYHSIFHYNSINYYNPYQQSGFIFPWIALEILTEFYYKLNKNKNHYNKYSLDTDAFIKNIKKYLKEIEHDKEESGKIISDISYGFKNPSAKEKMILLLNSIEFPDVSSHKKEIDELYRARSQVFHSGFYGEGSGSFGTQIMILQNLLSRVLLIKLDFRNDYVKGDFWDSPFTIAIG